jgi:hypothetical protein
MVELIWQKECVDIGYPCDRSGDYRIRMVLEDKAHVLV